MIIRIRLNKYTVNLSTITLCFVILMVLMLQLNKKYDSKHTTDINAEIKVDIKEDPTRQWTNSDGKAYNYIGLWNAEKGEYIIEPVYKFASTIHQNGMTLMKGQVEYEGTANYFLVDSEGRVQMMKSFDPVANTSRVFSFYNDHYLYTFLTDYATMEDPGDHDFEYFEFDGTPLTGYANFYITHGGLMVWLCLLVATALGIVVTQTFFPKKYRLFNLKK